MSIQRKSKEAPFGLCFCRKRLKKDELVLAKVEEGYIGPAEEKAMNKYVGFLLTAVDEQPVSTLQEFKDTVGTKIQIKLTFTPIVATAPATTTTSEEKGVTMDSWDLFFALSQVVKNHDGGRKNKKKVKRTYLYRIIYKKSRK